MTTISIATRESALALWQANHVKQLLEEAHPQLQVRLVPMTTRGDQILNRPLAEIGGKALFLKELEVAMLEGRADIAVHSLKDVPAELPAGLGLAAMLTRANPYDALVSNEYSSLDELPVGARVGTSSVRRRCLLSLVRPDLEILDLRGNVNTRLAKLDSGNYDAIILATAGLQRLGLGTRVRQELRDEPWLPAPGQGIVAVESRAEDEAINHYLECLVDTEAGQVAAAERALAFRLDAGCHVPLGGFARKSDGQLGLRAMLGLADGSKVIAEDISGDPESANALGLELAERILSRGGQAILDACQSAQ
jgi:hydroxymethylbilane synthase